MKGRGRGGYGKGAGAPAPGGGGDVESSMSVGFGFSALLRPDKFSGSVSTWRTFKQELLNFLEFVDSDMAAALERMSAKQPAPQVDPADGPLVSKARWLHSVLFALCKSGPAKRHLTAPPGAVLTRDGFSSWHRLLKEFEPATAARRVSLYNRLIFPTFQSNLSDEDWKSAFQEWETTITELRDLIAPREVDENLLTAILLSRSPASVIAALQSVAESWEDNYSGLKDRIFQHLDQRRSFSADVDAMEVDRVEEGRSCFLCGRRGHLARDCRASKTTSSSSSSSNAKGSSKGSSAASSSSSSSSKGSAKGSSKSASKQASSTSTPKHVLKGGKGKEKGKGKKKKVHVLEDVEENYEEEEWEEEFVEEEEEGVNAIMATIEENEEGTDVWEY